MVIVTLSEREWPEDVEHSWAYPNRAAAQAFTEYFHEALALEVEKTPQLRDDERLHLSIHEALGEATQSGSPAELFAAWIKQEKQEWHGLEVTT